MLCENCKKNVADTYFRKTVNGKTSEIFLCSECARQLGVTGSDGLLSDGFGIDTMLPNFFSRSHELLQELMCPECGIMFSDIAENGKVGCDKCYETFASRLNPAISRMHGNKKHIGKIPLSRKNAPVTELDDLKKQLEKAVSEERFEDAAKLRDKIKKAENKESKSE